MLNRSSGVLLNISSLPSGFGIGGFGSEIEEFCKFLVKGGFKYWQILPLTALGLGDSPYSSESAFAMNYLYVDPVLLNLDGFIALDDVEASKYKGEPWQVDYVEVKRLKSEVLHKAFKNKGSLINMSKFVKKNPWVKDYAAFKTLKELNNNKSWIEWSNEEKNNSSDTVKTLINKNLDCYNYFIFEQYVLNLQWENAKKTCHKYGINIIGDMPMYVSLDSSDVWSNREQFLLDKKGNPKKVAGVPPDYFSAEGQLWGNPIYDYKKMKENNFSWWLSRVDQMMNLYDILRIDHFRAFSAYWEVDADATTAKYGRWKKGSGLELFKEIYKTYSPDRFIAEDLGIIDSKVIKLLKQTKLPGMRVLQFGFDSDTSIHLPKYYTQNCIGYTATHDNNTTLGWLYELDDNTRRKVLKTIDCDYSVWGIGSYDNISVKKCIRSVFESKCVLAIAPFQDLCGFGSDCRMNTPGVANGNWKYRITFDQMQQCRIEEYMRLNKEVSRIND